MGEPRYVCPYCKARCRNAARCRIRGEDVCVCVKVFHIDGPADREPQPSDGPDYHADHAAWVTRQAKHNDGQVES